MVTFTSKRELTKQEKEHVFQELELISVISTLTSYIKYLHKHPERLEIKHVKNENGKGYQKVIEIPLPKLHVHFSVEIESKENLQNNNITK